MMRYLLKSFIQLPENIRYENSDFLRARLSKINYWINWLTVKL